MDTKLFVESRKRIEENCSKVIVGKEDVIDQILICLIASGHVLLEDLPGTGKTMLLRSFAKSIGTDFKRIQFTPDLLPSDLTGINFYNQKTGEFEFRKGPLFTNLVLADEINRAVPRSQSALLEAMEERQITVDGVTWKMESPYMVMATQNPVESYGTFPLPEAQLDRFFMRLKLGYMTREQEMSVISREDSIKIVDSLKCVLDSAQLQKMQESFAKVQVSSEIARYIMDIVDYTRKSSMLLYGVSVRASLALYKASQIYAAMNGRDYVIPEDVKKQARYVLVHRISLNTKTHMDNEAFVATMLEEVEVPLE
ncbi:MAG: AAA family ATPase [Spirochaetales bacterium]